MLEATKRNLENNIKRSLPICAMPIFLYFFMGPLTVYSSGLMGSHFYLADFYTKLAVLGGVLFLAMVVFASVLPSRLNAVMLTLTGYAGVMSYIQDMFLNVKLAENDGSPMKWDELAGYTRVNVIVWVVALIIVLLLFAKLKDKLVKVLMYIAVFVFAVQLVTWCTVMIQTIMAESQLRNQPTYSLIGDKQYTVASDGNIIVFVVDTYGSNQLRQGLIEDEGLANVLHDFTYYNNADSCYFRTFPSMTHMLTLEDVDFDKSMDDYRHEAWTSETARDMYAKIHDAGYDVYLYSTGGADVYGDAVNMSGLIDNATSVTFSADKNAAFIRMFKISIYKYVPYIIKPKFEVPSYLFGYIASIDNASDINCGNTLYYAGLTNGLTIDEETSNAVIIQHLDGTHEPYVTNALCEADDEADLLSTQQGIMYELDLYLSELKRLGVYDEATIIITADHSSWGDDQNGYDPQIVYFVKPAMQQQEAYDINSAPISHDDFMPTILDVIGVEYSEYGRSIFDIGQDEKRGRTIINQEYDSDYPRVPGCVSNIYTQYTYTGDLDDIINVIENDGPEMVYPIIK